MARGSCILINYMPRASGGGLRDPKPPERCTQILRDHAYRRQLRMATVPLQHDAAHMPMPKAHGFQTSARCSQKSGASVRRSWKGSTSSGLCWSGANQPPQRAARNLHVRKKVPANKKLSAASSLHTRAQKGAARQGGPCASCSSSSLRPAHSHSAIRQPHTAEHAGRRTRFWVSAALSYSMSNLSYFVAL